MKIKKLNENAIIPTRGSEHAAGYDLYACIDEPVAIAPYQTVKIGTGLSFQLPDNIAALIFARSGLATKHGLRPANCVGLCDPDYRGEYIVALHNDSDIPYKINPGDRIAQVVFVEYNAPKFDVVNELDDSNRGEGGFGSTGK